MINRNRNCRKLAFLIPSFSGGGAERVITNLANAMLSKGYAVDILLFSSKGPVKSSVLVDINIIEIGPFGLKAMFGLLKYLIKEKPACLISSLCHCNFLSIITAKATGTKCIIREANYPPAILSHSRNRLEKIAYGIYFSFYKYADLVLSPSKQIILILEKDFNITKTKLRLLSSPSIGVEFDELVNEVPEHPWLENDNYRVVLAVGRLEPAKGFSMLIKAMSILDDEMKLKLIILGEGSLKQELLELVNDLGLEDCVSLPGFVKNPYAYMRKADVFVLSSFYEGMPNVMVQAMAAGTSIVSTNCPTGPEELLENGKLGVLVPVGDSSQLAVGISKVLDSPWSKFQLQEKVAQYRIENVSLVFEELVREIIR